MTAANNSKIEIQRLPAWLAFAITFLMVALMVVARLAAPHAVFPVGFGVPLAVIAWLRRKSLLWGATTAFFVVIIIKYLIYLPRQGPAPSTLLAHDYRFAAALIMIDTFVIAGVGHLWISLQLRTQSQNASLEAANAELTVREEEIARNNEELQSQTEELEHQSEELRVTNEELAGREKMLQSLLDLSRSLTTELSQSETMARICQTLGQLVDRPGQAAAILEQVGDHLVVRCHHGFGEDGLVTERLPLEKSFAKLVLARGRVGYIEDLSLRNDLQVPQPRDGPPMVSILASPLRVGGVAIGTLEVYSREKTTWDAQQTSLTESLAAQTSVSLEAAQLFQQISAERQRSETVLRTMPFAVAVADKSCQDVRLNPAGATLFGESADINIATQAREWVMFQNGRQLSFEQFPVVRASRDAIDVVVEELEWVAPTGRRSFLLANARPIRDFHGNAVGAVAAFVDITPQKDLQRELDLRRREAEEASVRKTRFLAAVSHDIRTPANAISLLAELVRRTAANPSLVGEVPELANELHSSATSLVNLLSDVLDLARFDSGKIEMQESEFSLADLLEEEHRQMIPLARDKGLELKCHTPDGSTWLRTDRIKLARILGNLIGNAIKFTERGGIIVSGEVPNERGVRIRVADTGIGIPQEYQRHIFDEFFQMRNPERDRNKGTGLGLTICKRLVDAMGGSLEVESSIGKGSTFSVILPPRCVLPRAEKTSPPASSNIDGAL